MQPSSVAEPGIGLRERKKRARREALVTAAQTLVLERGLHGVTVDDICEVAGVSPRTFFNYFETKDDAVLGAGPWQLDAEAVGVFVDGGPTGDLPDDLVALVEVLLTHAPARREHIACAMELARRDPELLARQAAVMHRQHAHVAEVVGARLGVDADAARTELVTMLVLGMLRAAYVRWEVGDRTGDPADAVAPTMAELRALLAD